MPGGFYPIVLDSGISEEDASALNRCRSNEVPFTNSDVRKSWQLVNELSVKQPKRKVITDIIIVGCKITSASHMAEAFNYHFANIGHNLAADLPPADKEPKHYLDATNKL